MPVKNCFRLLRKNPKGPDILKILEESAQSKWIGSNTTVKVNEVILRLIMIRGHHMRHPAKTADHSGECHDRSDICRGGSDVRVFER